jgi:hypothetical protein
MNYLVIFIVILVAFLFGYVVCFFLYGNVKESCVVDTSSSELSYEQNSEVAKDRSKELQELVEIHQKETLKGFDYMRDSVKNSKDVEHLVNDIEYDEAVFF